MRRRCCPHACHWVCCAAHRGGDAALRRLGDITVAICFGNDALDLLQLCHQMQLRWQATGGVDQHHVFATCFAGGDGVKAHGGGVASVLADDVDGVAVSPDVQLLTRGSAKGVGSGQ